MSNELHTMPLMLEKLFSSRQVNMLKLDEFGAYIRLLGLAWLEGGKLPKDMEEIRRCLTIESEDQWKRIEKFVVKRFFHELPDEGKLTNSTLIETYQNVLNKIEDASGRGRIGANARWGKQCPSNAQAMQTHGLGNGNQSQSQSQSQSQREDLREREEAPARLRNFNPIQQEPTISEIIEQAEIQCVVFTEIEAEKFLRNYKGKGWMLNSGVIRDWRQYLKGWLEKAKQYADKSTPKEPPKMSDHKPLTFKRPYKTKSELEAEKK